MKRMSKSVKREIAWLLPTFKRLKIIERKVFERVEMVCYANNECCELLEIEKMNTNGYSRTNIIVIGDNLSYILKYAKSLNKFHEELASSCKEIQEILDSEDEMYRWPFLLRMRLKKVVYVSELLMMVSLDMLSTYEGLSDEFMDLIKEKMKFCSNN